MEQRVLDVLCPGLACASGAADPPARTTPRGRGGFRRLTAAGISPPLALPPLLLLACEKRTEVLGALGADGGVFLRNGSHGSQIGARTPTFEQAPPRHVMCDDEAMRLADLTSRPYSASKALGIGGGGEGGWRGAGPTADYGLVPLSTAC